MVEIPTTPPARTCEPFVHRETIDALSEVQFRELLIFEALTIRATEIVFDALPLEAWLEA